MQNLKHLTFNKSSLLFNDINGVHLPRQFKNGLRVDGIGKTQFKNGKTSRQTQFRERVFKVAIR